MRITILVIQLECTLKDGVRHICTVEVLCDPQCQVKGSPMPNMLSIWFQDQVNPFLAEEEIPVCVMRLRKNSSSATSDYKSCGSCSCFS